MSDAKREKLKRRSDAADFELSEMLESGEWTDDQLDRALDRHLKAFHELQNYPRNTHWGEHPEIGVAVL